MVEGFPLVVKPVDCDDILGSETRDGNVSRCASVTSGRRAQVSAPAAVRSFRGLSACMDTWCPHVGGTVPHLLTAAADLPSWSVKQFS